MNTNVFNAESFTNPANTFRPLANVHGLDNYLSDPGQLANAASLDSFWRS